MKQQQKRWIRTHCRHSGNFRKSRNHYGTRKIKKELADCGKQVSRRRIGRIMKQEGLVSSYTTAQFKPQKTDVMNQSRECVEPTISKPAIPQCSGKWFDLRKGRKPLELYLCTDWSFNREIIGYSAGEHKTAELVKQAFMKVDGNLSEIHISTQTVEMNLKRDNWRTVRNVPYGTLPEP